VPTLIEVDYRERSSLLFSKLRACPDLDVRVGALSGGDYIVAREIAVERKTAADFASSVIDARVFRQAQRLTATRLRPLVLVEGEPDPRLQGFPGVGPELARRLLQRFGSIERVIEADEEELCTVAVNGVGAPYETDSAKIRRRDSQMDVEGLKQKLDYDDLQDTPDDGLRYEIIDGALYVTPSPRPRHQRISKRLQRQLEAYFEGRDLGEVFNAPVDVILDWHDVVVPDLVVVTLPAQVTERAIEGSPTLLVEVLSPSTASRDRKVKCQRYAEKGVQHYWIVDAAHRSLECYRLGKTTYKHLFTAKGSTQVEHPDFPGLTLDLSALWR